MKSTIILFLFVLIFSSSDMLAQTDTNFVLLENGEKVYGNYQFFRPSDRPAFFMFGDSLNIPLSKVNAYQINNDYFARYREGMVSKFLYRTITGKIDLFEENLYIPGRNVAIKYTYEYFSKDNGNIIEANYENLSKALADNMESLGHLKKYNTLGYVQWGMVGAGAAIIVTGFATSGKGKSNMGMLIGGAVVAALSYIPYLIREPELRNAINCYNNK